MCSGDGGQKLLTRLCIESKRKEKYTATCVQNSNGNVHADTHSSRQTANGAHTHTRVNTNTGVRSLLTSICHLLYISLGASGRLQVGGAQAFLAASVTPASVHSTLSIPCQLVALRHILCNAQETGRPPHSSPPPTPPNAEPPGNGCYAPLPPPSPSPSPDKSLLGLSITALTAEGRQLGCSISRSRCTGDLRRGGGGKRREVLLLADGVQISSGGFQSSVWRKHVFPASCVTIGAPNMKYITDVQRTGTRSSWLGLWPNWLRHAGWLDTLRPHTSITVQNKGVCAFTPR